MAYADVVLADSPVAYYKCDDASGDLADSSGNGYTATKTNTGSVITYRQPGLPGDPGGYSIVDDGGGHGTFTTTYFAVPDNANTQIGDGPFSLEAWFKLASVDPTTPVDRTLFAWGSPVSANVFYRDWTHMYLTRQGSAAIADVANPTVQDSLWHHLVWTKNGATNKLYQDGVDLAPTFTNQTLSNPTGAQLPHALLAYEGGGADQWFHGWVGSIAHMAIYKSVLSAERVAAHFAAGKGATAPTGFINRVVVGLM